MLDSPVTDGPGAAGAAGPADAAAPAGAPRPADAAGPAGAADRAGAAGKVALEWIDSAQDKLTAVSDTIWRFAEVGLEEVRSAGLLKEELARAGFKVSSGVAGLPTAFTAVWGAGRPVLGFLAEYDALPHLSQAVSVERRPLEEGAPGHGCGHNLLGAGVLGAVLGLKEEMVRDGLPGTIIFFGCPAEELLVGKVFMAREGLFDDLDAALTWHPEDRNGLWVGTQALNSAKFTFRGVAAHAAANPDCGRSALDAVELMNVAANYLREHVPEDSRLHYVITEGGGEPNVVPARAEVWYYVRGATRPIVDDIHSRLLRCAQGAALMTDTTFEVRLLTACYEFLPNKTLGELATECLKTVGPAAWTREELDFARRLAETFGPGRKEAALRAAGLPAEYLGKVLDDTIGPPGRPMAGSSDVADVSWVAPTVNLTTSCGPLGIAFHSWQMTAVSGMSIGHKGMLLAAKTLAMAGSRLLREPELLAAARAEFLAATRDRPYKCAVPPEVGPGPDRGNGTEGTEGGEGDAVVRP